MIRVLVGQGAILFSKEGWHCRLSIYKQKKGVCLHEVTPLFCYARPEQMLVQANGINSTYQKVYPKVKSN